MENDSITERIIRICFDVHNELGNGYVEKIYENSLRVALEQDGFNVAQQTPIEVQFRGIVVGEFFADLLVDNSIILELKAMKGLLPEHQAQLINYLKATKMSKGLLINFGVSKLQIKRGFFGG
ncbi:MAG: GxxExxY protein [Verrucomicrobiia bacterium]